MTSAFIKLAAALPEGYDTAASALFVLGKSSLRDPVSFSHVLDSSAVRAAKRDTVAATVTAVMAAGDPASLAVHHGDSRISVQRALGHNPNTPPRTLNWLFVTAARRGDNEVLTSVAHRVTLDELFELATKRGFPWNNLDCQAIASKAVEAGDGWPERVAAIGHPSLTAALVAACVKSNLPFAHLVDHVEGGRDRMLAMTTGLLGYVDDAVVATVIESDPRAFVDECSRSHRRPKIDAHQYALLAASLSDTPRWTAPEAMLQTFSATPSSKELFLHAVRTSTDARCMSYALSMLSICTPEEMHEVVGLACRSANNRDFGSYAALPANALPATREMVCSHLRAGCIRRLLTSTLAAKLTHGELAALVGTPEQAVFAAHLVLEERVARHPWFDDFTDLLGQYLLRQVAKSDAVASYVSKRLVEALGESVDAIVLAAKLIHDGFVGSISELVATVLVMHPKPEVEPEAAAPEDTLGWELEQLELFA